MPHASCTTPSRSLARGARFPRSRSLCPFSLGLIESLSPSSRCYFILHAVVHRNTPYESASKKIPLYLDQVFYSVSFLALNTSKQCTFAHPWMK